MQVESLATIRARARRRREAAERSRQRRGNVPLVAYAVTQWREKRHLRVPGQ